MSTVYLEDPSTKPLKNPQLRCQVLIQWESNTIDGVTPCVSVVEVAGDYDRVKQAVELIHASNRQYANVTQNEPQELPPQ
jgi:hypothetical protein